jgi:hypothetical protein
MNHKRDGKPHVTSEKFPTETRDNIRGAFGALVAVLFALVIVMCGLMLFISLYVSQ